MIAPDPSGRPAARRSSTVSLTSRSFSAANAPAAPPISAAFSPPATPPARSSSRWRSVTPNGTSYNPGRATSPDTQNNFDPVDFPTPILPKTSAPFSTMYGTAASVSTLLIAVGIPNRPYSVGNGGLTRGKARPPSIDSNSAVSRSEEHTSQTQSQS